MIDMSKMMIENPEEIEFTTVNSFSIHFKYMDKYYILLHNTLTSKSLILYEKIGNSNRNLKAISSLNYYHDDFSEFVRYTHPKRTLKYIDKNAFVRRLVWYKLAYNKHMIHCCCEVNEYITYANKDIAALEAVLAEIKSDKLNKINRYLDSGITPNVLMSIDISNRRDTANHEIPSLLSE